MQRNCNIGMHAADYVLVQVVQLGMHVEDSQEAVKGSLKTTTMRLQLASALQRSWQDLTNTLGVIKNRTRKS